jgi:hypothetical protein
MVEKDIWSLNWMDKADVYRIVGASLSACQAGGVVAGVEAGRRHLYSMMRHTKHGRPIAMPQRFWDELLRDVLPEAHRRVAMKQPMWYLPDGWTHQCKSNFDPQGQ